MRRLVSRLVAFAALLLTTTTFYILWDRITYERLLNRLYITFDDFATDYASVLKQLPNDTALAAYNYSQYPPSDPVNDIPPSIHFIFFENLYEIRPEGTNIPSTGSEAPDLCRKKNPDFEVTVWDSVAVRALLEDQHEWFLPTYDAYAHPIQRVDAAKYFILYTYGGFYLDLDIACRRSLKPLQGLPAWLARASPQGLENDALATRAGHPAWKKMIESLESRHRRSRYLLFPYLIIFWSTGPQFTTDVIKLYLEENPTQRDYVPGSSKSNASPDDLFILPQEFYSEQYTFFGHTPGGTWHEGDVAVVLWFVARPWLLVLGPITCAMLVLIVKYRALLFRWRWRYLDNRTNKRYTSISQEQGHTEERTSNVEMAMFVNATREV